MPANVFHHNISFELDNILKECSKSNWDGYGGQSVDEDSCNNVMFFVRTNSEQLSLTKPELTPNSHGLIDMEWWSEDKSIALTLTFHIDGVVSFGFVNKNTEQENCGSFDIGKVPNTILEYLNFFKT